MQIDYTVQVWREDGQFIPHAMPLDVASSGPTAEAARNAVDEAVRLFLATAAEHGTLTEVLEDAGYRRVRREWRGSAEDKWLPDAPQTACAPCPQRKENPVTGRCHLTSLGFAACR